MNILTITQIVIAFLIIASIMLQTQQSGQSLGWGGLGDSYHTKRGLEKTLFTATFILIGIFALVSLVILRA